MLYCNNNDSLVDLEAWELSVTSVTPLMAHKHTMEENDMREEEGDQIFGFYFFLERVAETPRV